MTDYYHPAVRAVLVAASRTGSTFLQTALSNHPDIGCERCAPLSPFSPYVIYMLVRDDHMGLCQALLNRPGYKANVFKLTYRQFRDEGAEKFMAAIGATHIMHLSRENVLRIVFSALINTMGLAGNLRAKYLPHAFTPADHAKVTIDPAAFLAECVRYEANVQQMREEISRCHLPTLNLTYEMIAWNALSPHAPNQIPAATGKLICDFLGVGQAPMTGVTARMHPAPLPEYIQNWADLCAALAGTAYQKWIDREITYAAEWAASERKDSNGNRE